MRRLQRLVQCLDEIAAELLENADKGDQLIVEALISSYDTIDKIPPDNQPQTDEMTEAVAA